MPSPQVHFASIIEWNAHISKSNQQPIPKFSLYIFRIEYPVLH